jgi:hypothetical protein
MTADNRTDSGPIPAVAQPTPAETQILGILAEVRASQKGLDIKVDGLTDAHGQQKIALNNLGTAVADVKVELARVSGVASNALATAQDAKKGVSQTQQEFSTTLAAVNVATNKTADQAAKVAVMADAHTVALAALTTVNNNQTLTLEKIQKFAPLLNAIAISIAVAAAAAVQAYTHFKP